MDEMLTTPPAEPRELTDEEILRNELQQIKLRHTQILTAIAYTLTGDQATQKASNDLARQAMIAALGATIADYYQGRIVMTQDEKGNVTFEGANAD